MRNKIKFDYEKWTVHSVGKSNYTAEGAKRGIVALSVYKINKIAQNNESCDECKAHITLISRKVSSINDDEDKELNYIVHVEFKNKKGVNAFKLECEFSLLLTCPTIDESLTLKLEMRCLKYLHI